MTHRLIFGTFQRLGSFMTVGINLRFDLEPGCFWRLRSGGSMSASGKRCAHANRGSQRSATAGSLTESTSGQISAAHSSPVRLDHADLLHVQDCGVKSSSGTDDSPTPG